MSGRHQTLSGTSSVVGVDGRAGSVPAPGRRPPGCSSGDSGSGRTDCSRLLKPSGRPCSGSTERRLLQRQASPRTSRRGSCGARLTLARPLSTPQATTSLRLLDPSSLGACSGFAGAVRGTGPPRWIKRESPRTGNSGRGHETRREALTESAHSQSVALCAADLSNEKEGTGAIRRILTAANTTKRRPSVLVARLLTRPQLVLRRPWVAVTPPRLAG